MLDEKDLQAIAQLMAQQKQEIIGELDARMDQKLASQKKEIMGEVTALMEAYFEPKFNLLADGLAAVEVNGRKQLHGAPHTWQKARRISSPTGPPL